MIKWFAYIVLLLIMTPGLSSAKEKGVSDAFSNHGLLLPIPGNKLIDTISSRSSKHQQEVDDKKKIKEIAKARRQPKPEKIAPFDASPGTVKQKPKRQRRPEGLEQPPEIPRRNDN